MSIHAASDDSYYKDNRMRYIAEIDDDQYIPSSIYFSVFVPPAAFSVLAQNIRSGLIPVTATIKLVDDQSFFTSGTAPKKMAAIEFGWEPDGSGLIWHNREKENLTIPIESVRFEYAVAKPRHDEKIDRPLCHAPEDRANEQIALKYLRWIATGVIALAIMIAALILRRF
jgi:hypothetical protein